CFSDVLGIPFVVDMAIICVKAELVPLILEQCGKKDIKNAVIISAGFNEAGNNELAEKTKAIARKYSIKIIGPNVLGIINPYKNMNASFFSELPEKGNISFISQSGAVGTAILDKCLQEKTGISLFISLGNMMNQDFIPALEYAGNDAYTEIIMLYIESLGDEKGKKFVELCRKISQKKKIIAIKAGKTKEGEKAAKTHTASLSSPSKIYSSAFKQAGIIEVDSLNEMFRIARVLSRYKKIGKKACIITNAGGLGILAADSCSKAGIKLEEIREEVLRELDGIMPKGYSRNNPLDIMGDALAERYEKAIKILSKQEYDFFIVIVSPQEMTQAIETAQLLLKMKKPVFACFIGGKKFEQTKFFLR
ncbi:MAG: CoA-binding protein, partial [Nanoarchaeota archaeon]